MVTEVTHRIERMNLFESTEHKADVAGIINVALSELEFEFKKGISEELRIVVNDIRERCERYKLNLMPILIGMKKNMSSLQMSSEHISVKKVLFRKILKMQKTALITWIM